MKKSVLLQVATSALLVLSVSIIAVSTYSARTVQARNVEEAGRAEPPQWEYAVIGNVTELRRGDKPSEGTFMGIAELCYARESGCQELKIEGSDRAAALVKAMAKLGDDKWEMVVGGPFPARAGSQDALFFKRPKR